MEGPETRALNQSFLDMNEGMLALIRKDWPGLTYRKGMDGRRALEKFFFDVVPQRRGKQGNDMATFFANEKTEDGDYYSDKVVGEHLIFLLLAAHDTTTSALTMAVHYLAHDQQWQDRLREELQALGKPHLEYEDLCESDGPGSLLQGSPADEPAGADDDAPHGQGSGTGRLPAAAPHHGADLPAVHPHGWKSGGRKPHQFDPDRFTREEHKQHSFLWAPFGGGAHKCIGLHFADMLFKAALSGLLLNYRIRFVKPGQYDGRMQYFPFAKPMDNLPLVLEPL